MANAPDEINRIVSEGIQAMVRVQIADVVSQAAKGAAGQTGQALSVFAAAMNSSVRRSRGARIQRIHQEAGLAAQGAILAAYKSRERRNPSKPYRDSAPGKWKRDSNGAMERALKSPEFFKATGTQLSFIDMNAMDRGARQWYRLNFGAGPAGATTPRPGAFPMQILGRKTGMALTLGGNKANTTAYSMPAGFWEGSGSGSEFIPLGYLREIGKSTSAKNAKRSFSKKRMSIGFPGYNYLDAGLPVLSQMLGDGYTILANEWFQEAVSKNTGPVAFVISSGEAAKLLPTFEKRIAAIQNRSR